MLQIGKKIIMPYLPFKIIHPLRIVTPQVAPLQRFREQDLENNWVSDIAILLFIESKKWLH